MKRYCLSLSLERLKKYFLIWSSVFPFSQVNKVLAALQVEVENFILRMAAEFPLRKEQLIFLINNYDMMLAVLMVSMQKHTKVDQCHIKFAGTHLYTWVERGTMRHKCLAQEHNTMSQARFRTGDKRTIHEATPPPTFQLEQFWVINVVNNNNHSQSHPRWRR